MMMRKIFVDLIVLGFLFFSGGMEVANAKDAVTMADSKFINAGKEDLQGICEAIAHYINAGRKGDSKIAMLGFAPAATMTWSENNALKTVPISELYKYFDEKPRDASCELVACDVAGDIATARIESVFDDAKFTDMFTLVKDGQSWKIVSKVYHVK